ncbi:MAG: NMD3-related protein [Nanoarchaeota archaeon]
MHANYFEAILQIRPKKQSILEFVRNDCLRNGIMISKEISKDFGYDLYLSSRKYTVQVSKKLKKSFGGTLTFSKTLHTRNRMSSKLVYRITVLYRAKQF